MNRVIRKQRVLPADRQWTVLIGDMPVVSVGRQTNSCPVTAYLLLLRQSARLRCNHVHTMFYGNKDIYSVRARIETKHRFSIQRSKTPSGYWFRSPTKSVRQIVFVYSGRQVIKMYNGQPEFIPYLQYCINVFLFQVP